MEIDRIGRADMVYLSEEEALDVIKNLSSMLQARMKGASSSVAQMPAIRSENSVNSAAGSIIFSLI